MGRLPGSSKTAGTFDGHTIIKSETLPDGRRKMILKEKDTGDIVDRIVSG